MGDYDYISEPNNLTTQSTYRSLSLSPSVSDAVHTVAKSKIEHVHRHKTDTAAWSLVGTDHVALAQLSAFLALLGSPCLAGFGCAHP